MVVGKDNFRQSCAKLSSFAVFFLSIVNDKVLIHLDSIAFSSESLTSDTCKAFSHDVRSAILIYLNSEKSAILVGPTLLMKRLSFVLITNMAVYHVVKTMTMLMSAGSHIPDYHAACT